MKAHVQGFYWDFIGGYGKSITLDDLAAQLTSISDSEFTFNGYERIVYASSTKEHILGLLLTAKNHKKFCELRREGKVKTINVREAEKNVSLIDFNFFLIDKRSGRGLYQYYHNSCNARIFSRLILDQFDKIAANKIAEEIAAKRKANKLTETEEEKIREKYHGDLVLGLHVRKENFAALVRKLQKIKACEFTLATIEPEKTGWFRILKGVQKVIRHRVSFERSASLGERAKAIINLQQSGEIADATVEGQDEHGLDKVITVMNNPDSFGHWEFDDIAAEMTFEPAQFKESKFMETLLGVAEEQKDFLQKKAK